MGELGEALGCKACKRPLMWNTIAHLGITNEVRGALTEHYWL